MNPDYVAYFITWTTYGTWLPGDSRGWRKSGEGNREPQPLLEDWCRERMTQPPVKLNDAQREKVERICREHALFRSWEVLGINVRTNHVHVVVFAPEHTPQIVRDQLKANATRVLRMDPNPLVVEKVWTRGGDCEVIETYDELERVLAYVVEGQDRRIGD